MDPKACLMAAWEALQSADGETARNHLDAYASWRRMGGFEPNDIPVFGQPYYGDEIASMLEYKYALAH